MGEYRTYPGSCRCEMTHFESEEGVVFVKHQQYGEHGFFCKYCYAPIVIRANFSNDVEYDSSLEFFNITTKFSWKCPSCGKIVKTDFMLDPNITEIIALLNKKGYLTDFCCEGHLHYDGYTDAYISFNRSVLINIIDEYPLPYPWYRDCEISEDIDYFTRLVIRCCPKVAGLKKRMSSIYEWVNKLPDYNDWLKKFVANGGNDYTKIDK